MDVLADVLRATRVRGSVACRSELSAPWALRYDEPGRAGFHVVAQGSCWLRVPGRAPLPVAAGDVVLLPRGVPHVLADAPATPAVSLARLLGDGPRPSRLVHGGGGAPTVLLCGSYTTAPGEPHPVLARLPDVVHLPAGARTGGWTVDPLGVVLQLVAAEAEQGRPGAEVVVDRLVDALLVYVVRGWVDAQGGGSGGWIGALGDPVVGAALTRIHTDPAHPWTVAALGDAAGMSRAAFARRFTALVGEPPLAYLTRWRMTLAAEALADSDDGVEAIGRRVGYTSSYAFAKAFKRERGVAPGRYRATRSGRTTTPAGAARTA